MPTNAALYITMPLSWLWCLIRLQSFVVSPFFLFTDIDHVASITVLESIVCHKIAMRIAQYSTLNFNVMLIFNSAPHSLIIFIFLLYSGFLVKINLFLPEINLKLIYAFNIHASNNNTISLFNGIFLCLKMLINISNLFNTFNNFCD